MVHILNEDFKKIGKKILAEKKDLQEWSLIESDDMFHEGIYSGGFDSIEMEFCFSVFADDEEYWFQLSLLEVEEVVSGVKTDVEIRKADC